jgi:hypothetical protein
LNLRRFIREGRNKPRETLLAWREFAKTIDSIGQFQIGAGSRHDAFGAIGGHHAWLAGCPTFSIRPASRTGFPMSAVIVVDEV